MTNSCSALELLLAIKLPGGHKVEVVLETDELCGTTWGEKGISGHADKCWGYSKRSGTLIMNKGSKIREIKRGRREKKNNVQAVVRINVLTDGTFGPCACPASFVWATPLFWTSVTERSLSYAELAAQFLCRRLSGKGVAGLLHNDVQTWYGTDSRLFKALLGNGGKTWPHNDSILYNRP